MKSMKKVLFSLLLAALLSFFAAETVDYNAVALTSAVPGGYTLGIKLHIEGLLVVGISDIPSGGISYSPAKQGGICKGDRITHINDNYIDNANEFIKAIQQSGGNTVALTVVREQKVSVKNLSPVFYEEANEYKTGMWVRDSTTGIGTVTFVLPDGSFAALGHGISDIDTEKIITINHGDVTGSRVVSVLKGERGAAGELRGIFDGATRGEILQNAESGIYGRLEKAPSGNPMEIAAQSEVREGEAVICSNIDGTAVEEFSVIIEKVMGNRNDGKNMVIRVNDAALIERTGGIVQGMSGSPIIQDGKIVGAVTHVFLDEPTMGYAIFASKMLETLSESKK